MEKSGGTENWDLTTCKMQIRTSGIRMSARTGCGNRWVLLLEPRSGLPTQVLWASHDAPVTLVAEDSFDEFCRRIITDTESFLDHIGNCERDIWKSKPQGISLEQARASTDQVIREVADGLDDSWRV